MQLSQLVICSKAMLLDKHQTESILTRLSGSGGANRFGFLVLASDPCSQEISRNQQQARGGSGAAGGGPAARWGGGRARIPDAAGPGAQLGGGGGAFCHQFVHLCWEPRGALYRTKTEAQCDILSVRCLSNYITFEHTPS